MKKNKGYKLLLILIIALLLASCLLGCSKKVTEGKEDNTPLPENTQAEAPPTIIVEKKQGEVETSGGIALFGTVKKDDSGYYLLLLQATTIKYQYSKSEPASVYSDCERVEFFPDKDDNVYKSVYLDKEVTVTGMLSNFPDKEKLSIFIYTISVGKTIDFNSAASCREVASVGFANDYDKTIKLPQRCNPVYENGAPVWNEYAVGSEALYDMGNGFAEFFIGFTEAFLNFETECSCKNVHFAQLLDNYMPFELPLYTESCLITVKHFDPVSEKLYWGYTYDTKQEHDRRIDEFREIINGYLTESGVKQSDTEIEKAKKLYHVLSMKLKYNYDDMETQNRTQAYYGFTESKGICTTFTRCYNFLLKQVGIECYYTHAGFEDGESHAWSTVFMGGKYYFCDTTYENGLNGGIDYIYFGMTLKDRENDGSAWLKDDIRIGEFRNRAIGEFEISKDRVE